MVPITHDLAGNRTADGNGTYAHDWANRLRSATVGGTTVAYGYSGDSIRTSRTVGANPAEALLWDREAGLAELVDDGTLAYVQDAMGEVAAIDATGAASYPLGDAIGTARARTDGSGSVVGTADYDAWGNARTSSGTQGRHGWAGEQTDGATGLTYLRGRDYAPGSGRFLQQDSVSPSVGGTQGYNPYPYAANNPTTMTDASGMSPVDEILPAIEAVKGLIAKLRDLSQLVRTVPPMLRPLVGALIGFVAWVARLMVFLIVGWIMERVIGWASNTLVGGALKILGWVRMLGRGAKAGMKICSKIGRWACLNAPRLLTKVPKPCWKSVAGGAAELGIEAAGDGISRSDVGWVAAGIVIDCMMAGYKPYQGAALGINTPKLDPVTGRLFAIDTTTYTARKTNARGYPADPAKFWSAWKKAFPHTLSRRNSGRAGHGSPSPEVDEQWIEHFSEHKEYMGRTLDHHHVLCGPLAVPVPDTLHRGYQQQGVNHADCP